MRAIWKGNITFALVTIPISVFSATRSSDVSFKYLHKQDLSRVSYKRFCEAEEKEVPWEEITRGYEYEKDRFVEITDEELKQVNVELTRTIQIIEFVDEKEIDALYFDKPYYLEPQKGGERAYALMREALARAGKVGVARVVLKSKEHLAAVKPVGKMITMQTMRFSHEIVDTSELNLPDLKDVSKKEMSLANTLIEAMCDTFDLEKYKDEYRGQLLDIIQKKVDGVAPVLAGTTRRTPGRVVDLMEVLKQSLEEKKKTSRRAVDEKTVATRAREGRTKARSKTKTKK